MPAIKLSINDTVDYFKRNFSLLINNSTILDLLKAQLPVQSDLLWAMCLYHLLWERNQAERNY